MDNSELKTQQNYTLSIADLVSEKYVKKSAKTWFGKLGSALTLVVEVLPFAGLFAAIGGILIGDANNEAMYTAGLVFSDIGQTVLSNLSLLFMFSIILGFTNAKGFSIYSSLIGYIAFVGFQLPFIRYTGSIDIITGSANNFNIWFWHNLGVSTQMSNILGFGNGPVMNPDFAKGEFVHLSYEGIKTLNTGVLGGIALGFIYSYIYNKTKDLKLPSILSFFEGEKFTSVICLITAPIVASLFIIVWPGVNYVLGEIGYGLIGLPGGLDSFLFGLIKYWLLPFQAHAAFYSPLWWTNAGGQISTHQVQIMEAMIHRVMTGQSAGIFQETEYYDNTILPYLNKHFSGLDEVLRNNLNGNGWGSETYIWDKVKDILSSSKGMTASQLSTLEENFKNYGTIKWSTVGDQTMTMELLSNDPWFDMRDSWSANLKVTRFISGGYANLMFATPAIGFAMWGTLDKDRRRKFFPLYWGAVLPCLILGVSEPIMFMFAFIMPGIYFIWYTPFYAILFWIGSIFQVKLGSTFSQGLVDYIINGIIPTFTRSHDGVTQTNFWEPLVMGVIAFPIAYYLFKLIFIKYEFAAPGSAAAEQSGTEETSKYKAIKPKVDGWMDYLGSKQNIKEFKYDGKNAINVELKNPNIDRNSFIQQQFVKSVLTKGNNFTIKLKNKTQYFIDSVLIVQNYIRIQNMNINKKQINKQQLKLNNVEANWIIKENKLDNLNPEQKLAYKHTLRTWYLKHLKQNQINKVMDSKLIPFSKEDKELLKQENDQYSQQLKQLKIAKKNNSKKI